MFPLADVRGRVRGFGARQMPGGEPPKYLNSPEGPLFRKNEVLYGLDRARSAIATAGRAIVVEGYTDVLALHQSGTANAVASMGTARHPDGQVTELKRVVPHRLPRVRLRRGRRGGVAPRDGAGRGERPLRARVALPAGQDPADVVLADPDAFARSVEAAAGVLSFRVGRALGSAARADEDLRAGRCDHQPGAAVGRARRAGAARGRPPAPDRRPRGPAEGGPGDRAGDRNGCPARPPSALAVGARWAALPRHGVGSAGSRSGALGGVGCGILSGRAAAGSGRAHASASGRRGGHRGRRTVGAFHG